MTDNEKKRALICGFAVFAVTIMAATAFVCLADDSSAGTDNREEHFWIDNVRYIIVDDHVQVAEIKDKTGNFDLPDSVEHKGKTYPVTEIIYHVFGYDRIPNSITIGPNVKKIEEDAFEGYVHLRHFKIRDLEHSQLEYIGKKAFGLTEICTIELPKSLKTIGKRAFERCDNLWKCVLHSDSLVLDKEAFYGCCRLSDINLEHVTSIGTECFNGAHRIKECNLSSIRDINARAFADAGAVKHVIYGKDLQYIGKNQFVGLKFVDFDGNVISETHENLRGHEFVVGEDHRMHQIA